MIKTIEEYMNSVPTNNPTVDQVDYLWAIYHYLAVCRSSIYTSSDEDVVSITGRVERQNEPRFGIDDLKLFGDWLQETWRLYIGDYLSLKHKYEVEDTPQREWRSLDTWLMELRSVVANKLASLRTSQFSIQDRWREHRLWDKNRM